MVPETKMSGRSALCFAYQLERRDAVESRHREVGDREIPTLRDQRVRKGFGRIDAIRGDRIASA
jgi:hypothetical protein